MTNNNNISELENINKINPISFFGIGLFFALALFNFSYLFNNIIREILMVFQLDPYFNFWITEFAIVIFLALSIEFILKKLIRINIQKSSKYLIYAVSLFFLSFILRFLFHNFFIQMLDISLEIKDYNVKIIDSALYYLLFQLFDVLSYVIITVLIFKFIKKYSLVN